MPFQIIRNDITKVRADIIVNSANPEPIVGTGTDSAVYEAAGKEELLRERKKIGHIKPGNVAYTDAFAADAEYIIHTVGPVWVDGNHGEREELHLCYRNSLELAKELGAQSIAFPLISSGNYRFPKDEALSIALFEISSFLMKNDMLVILVVFDKRSFELSGKLFVNIKEYIDEQKAAELRSSEYKNGRLIQRSSSADISNFDVFHGDKLKNKEISAEDAIKVKGETFREKLFRLIDEKDMSDVDVYKRANIDRKLFSKIRSNKDYKPKKKTAVALAIALELDENDATDLLLRAGYAFSPGDEFDIAILYFIRAKEYDIIKINAFLFDNNLPILY